MPGETNHGMQCAEFDALLTEALDGTLAGTKLERFRAHATVCPLCGPLFAEVDAGRRLLKSLAEVEPPDYLVNNILAATTGLDTTRLHDAARRPSPASWLDRARAWMAPVTAPVFGVIRQPRFAMSFGMAFFSLSLALNAAGVKMADLKHIDLRPSALVRDYHMTTGRIVKYYENIRFVYQIESKVREIKRATTPAEPAPEETRPRKDNNTSGQPEQRQERNYSQGENQPILASTPDDPPVVTVTAIRRFV
jgi:putative zinc finger protein